MRTIALWWLSGAWFGYFLGCIVTRRWWVREVRKLRAEILRMMGKPE